MHSRNTFNKIKFGGHLYSFNSDNGGRFTSPNGGYSYNVYDRAIARGMSEWQAEELAKAHQAKQDWEEAQQQQEFWREYMFMLENPNNILNNIGKKNLQH
jgi:hypothetical protein